MTREEAIKELIRAFDVLDHSSHMDNRRKEAFNMAKTALEQAPTTKENLVVEDAISRQAVLDGIEELKKSPWATDKRGNGFEYLITEALDVVAELCVKRESPVTPQPKTGYWKGMKNESIAIQYCINIPENATNGDVIKAVFPNADFDNACPFCDGRWEIMPLNTDVYKPTQLRTYKDWWNAPYRQKSEDE